MKSVNYRSRFGVYIEILSALNEGLAISTRIIQRANLSYEHFTVHVQELVSRELVAMEEFHGSRSYSITPKGRTLLEQMKDTEEFLLSFGLSLMH